MRGSSAADGELAQAFGFPLRGGAIERHGARPIGIQADAQQLRVHVGALEFRRDFAQHAAHARDARRPAPRRIGGRPAPAAGLPGNRERRAAGPSLCGGRGGRAETRRRAERVLQQALVKLAVAGVAGGFPQVPPRHAGFQLVAARRLRPAQRIALQRALAGQREDGVKLAAAARRNRAPWSRPRRARNPETPPRRWRARPPAGRARRCRNRRSR